MNAIFYGLWRAFRVFFAGAVAVILILPPDKWLAKETLAIAVAAGLTGLFKFLRDQYGFDIKVM